MNDSSRDPLDDLLAQARWPEPAAEARKRLDAAWNENARPRSRAWVTWSMSAAAMLAIGCGIAWMVTQRPHAPPPVATAVETPATSAPVTFMPVIGREPTMRDIVLIRAAERLKPEPAVIEQPVARDTNVVAPRDQNHDAKQQTIATMLETPRFLTRYLELVVDRQTRADALAAARNAKNVPVNALFAQLHSPRADLRVAAAQVLGEIDGPVITRRLIAMIRVDQNRREAFLALASSRGREAQEFLKQAAASDSLASWAQSAMAQTAQSLN